MKPTGAAWRLGLIALGLTGAAVNTGNNLLYLLLGVFAAVVIVDGLLARSGLRALDAVLDPPRFARVGSPFTVEIRLRHRGRAPDARGLGLILVSRGATLGSAWVERVARGETVVVRVRCRISTRGAHRVLGVVVRTTSPFDLVRRERLLGRPIEILVLPSGDAHGRPPSTSLPTPGIEGLAARIAGDEYEGLRRGSERDDVRRIDWKSTARHGEVMLRETAGEARARVLLRLRTRLADAKPSSVRRFESDVARLATAGQRALATGAAVDLLLDDGPAERFEDRSAARFLARVARLRATAPDGSVLAPIPFERESTAPAATHSNTPPARAHGLSARAASAVGLTALWSLGALSSSLWLLAGAVLATTTVWPSRLVARHRGLVHRLWILGAFVALVVFVGHLLLRESPIVASVHLVLFITLYMACNARTTQDDRTMLLVSLLHLVLAAALTTELVFAPFLAAWLFFALHGQMAWAAAPMRGTVWRPRVFGPAGGPLRYGPATAVAVATVLVLGLVVFMIVPHVGTGTFSAGREISSRMSGFSDSASLGDIGRIKLDSTPVMEVELATSPPERFDVKWRGVALEDFDGKTWRRGASMEQAVSRRSPGTFTLDAGGRSAQPFVQRIRLEPDASGVIFAAERSREIRSRDIGVMLRDGAGSIRSPVMRRTIRYTVVSQPLPPDPDRLRRATGIDPREVARSNLALPSIDPRIAELARRLTDSETTRYDAVTSIERWLATERLYTLEVNDRGSADPLVDFLVDGKPGHCEYFATSMVVLARSAGIPSRFVTGYLRGEPNRFRNGFVVRRSDAHAWVEVHFPGEGWVAFDPTPPAGRESIAATGVAALARDLYATVKRWWDDELIGIDLDDQVQRMFAVVSAIDAKRLAGLVVLASIALVALRTAARVRPQRGQRLAAKLVPRFYRKTLKTLRHRGFRRHANETPAELLRRAAPALGANELARMRVLTADYYRLRFGPPPASSSPRAEA